MKNIGQQRVSRGAGGVLQSVSHLHGPLLYLLLSWVRALSWELEREVAR